MGEILSIRKIDFAFDFATTNLSAGGSTASGDTSTTEEYELDNDSVMEVCGLELIGPIAADGARQKIEHVKIKVDGELVPDIIFNELMAPAYHISTKLNYPFFGGSGRYKDLPYGMCFNLGVPMMMGGNPDDATIKVGPKETLGFEIKAPRAAENGGTIDQNMIVRVTVAEAKTQAVLERVLGSYGLVAGGSIDQSFEVIDLSTNDRIAVTKNVPLNLDMWTSLHGGMAAAKPYVTNFITYAQNATATTTNSEYRFTRSGTRVLHDPRGS